jgi:hypothetical protein
MAEQIVFLFDALQKKLSIGTEIKVDAEPICFHTDQYRTGQWEVTSNLTGTFSQA